MKKFKITIFFLFSAYLSVAQTTLIQENFTIYDGTTGTVPTGWYFSYNGDYNSATYSGTSGPNSYKFGVNNATIVSPAFAGADSVRFWIKGSATDTASYLTLYETQDSITWTQIVKIKPLPTTGATSSYHLKSASIHLMFVYTKSAGNVAFDDFMVKKNATSTLSGKIKVYFNNPVNTAVSIGVPAIYLDHLVDDTLIAYINRAKLSIDVAVYNYNQSSGISNIATAINNAYSRGVKIRWIYDGGSSNSSLPLLNNNIHTLGSPTSSSYGIMHNKFMIVDAGSTNANDPVVWTGSTNWSAEQMNSDVNNVIIFQDQNLAQAYTTEFNEMWGGTGLSPNTTNSKFGPDKTDNTPHTFNVGGITVEQYFSPSDGTNLHILQAINSANVDMYFGVYTFTEATDANAIKDRIQNHSVYTAGIIDQYSQTFSPYTILNPVMGNLLKVYATSNIYHNKMVIIDPSAPYSDPQVETGSHNWTSSADQLNDENIVIVHDATIANIYYQSFYQNFKDLGGTLAVITGTGHDYKQEPLLIYPNPCSDYTMIKPNGSTHLNNVEIKLFDLFGNEVLPHISPYSDSFLINTQNMQPGIYLLKITSPGSVQTERIEVIR